MFDRIKLIFRGAGIAFKHGPLIGSILAAWNRYPGLENSETLRLWLKPLLTDAQALALLTPTPVDDAVALAALRIVENDRTWAVVHAMALLAQEGSVFKDGVLIPEDKAYQNQLAELNDAAQEVVPDSPILIHVAVGLLLLLLKRWK
jgi:hypothetical protein